jgi:hypothetical protein
MDITTSSTSGNAAGVPSQALVRTPITGDDGQTVATGASAWVWVVKRSSSGKPPIYTCLMHPQIHESKPGFCPICHMKLVPKAEGGALRAHLVKVKTGVDDGNFTQILSGLKPGETVIKRGYEDLQDGDAVVDSPFDADGALANPIPVPQENAKETESSGDMSGMSMPGMHMPGQAGHQ